MFICDNHMKNVHLCSVEINSYMHTQVEGNALTLYGTAQFKLDIYTCVTREISRATHKFHASKSLKHTFTCMSLESHSTNLSGHSRVVREV